MSRRILGHLHRLEAAVGCGGTLGTLAGRKLDHELALCDTSVGQIVSRRVLHLVGRGLCPQRLMVSGILPLHSLCLRAVPFEAWHTAALAGNDID